MKRQQQKKTSKFSESLWDHCEIHVRIVQIQLTVFQIAPGLRYLYSELGWHIWL